MIWAKTKGSRYGLNCCQSIKNWSQSILDEKSFQSISGGAPTGTTSNPTPMLLPMIGKIVHGLLVNAPASTATRLNRNAQAQNSAVRVWSPYVGVNAMKVPTEKASAVRWGDAVE